MTVLLTITIALLVTFIGARLAAYFNYPSILGQFVASIILAIPIIKDNVFTPESLNTISIFAELAIIFLMLLTGLETDLKRVEKSQHESILISMFGSIVPLIFGTLLGLWLGLSLIASFILGISLSITAEGTNLAVLLQMGKLKTKIGTILLSAGMLDDILGIFYLSIILIIVQENGLGNLLLFPVKLSLFVGVIWIATKLMPSLVHYFEQKKRSDIITFNVSILIALILAILSEIVGLSAVIGAFIAGLIMQKAFQFKRDEKREEHEMETFLFGFIIPFFFINIALNFDYASLFAEPKLTLLVIVVAILGKMIGVFMVKPFSKLKWRQLYLIGWGMNSRGVMELIIANIALKAGLISTSLYSAIVLMAIITSLIFPIFMKKLIKKNPNIMNA